MRRAPQTLRKERDIPTYAPSVATFVDAIEAHEFDDGWKLLELNTNGDLNTLGQVTHNCVGARWTTQLLPGPEDELTAQKERFRARWDTPENREQFGEAWVEERCAGFDKCPLPKRYYKIFALVDDENKARAAVILGEKNAVASRTCTYASYDDLGQKGASSITLDDFEFVVLQITYGISWMPEDAGSHVRTWWQEKADGEWDEDGYQAKLTRYAKYAYSYA